MSLTNDERAMLDAAMEVLLRHLRGRGHGRKFWTSRSRVEFICARCGEVLFDGPPFDDPAEGFALYEHRPGRHRPKQRRRKARRRS
jgi:hypothetical protein